jgi:hypothetical protein
MLNVNTRLRMGRECIFCTLTPGLFGRIEVPPYGIRGPINHHGNARP